MLPMSWLLAKLPLGRKRARYFFKENGPSQRKNPSKKRSSSSSDLHELSRWSPLVSYGFLWIPMDSDRFLLIPMDTSGFFRAWAQTWKPK